MSKREYERVPLSEDELLERRDVNSRRARLGLACGVAFCVGAVAYVVTNPTLPPAKRLAAASVTGEVTYHELLEIDSVCSWIEAWEGVDDCASLAEAKVLKYVPRKMTTSYDADLVEKAVGSAASDGYLAFNLVYEDASGSLTSSWLVAMAYDGTVRTMTPLYEGDALHRAAGLKMWDDDELLLAVGKDTSLDGYAYKWNWRSGDYAKYSTKEIDIHDVQRANSGASFWALYGCSTKPPPSRKANRARPGPLRWQGGPATPARIPNPSAAKRPRRASATRTGTTCSITARRRAASANNEMRTTR